MNIVKTNSLSAVQVEEITQLETAAYKKYRLQNNVFLSNDINFDRRIPCFFLGYVGERLVSFLTLFIPTRQEAEITAFTHPDYCNKGCFTLLLDEAREVLGRVSICEVLFAVEPRSKSGMSVLKRLGCYDPERSEYRMTVTSLDKAPDCSGIKIFDVDHSNKELFRTAVSVVFPNERDMDNFYSSIVDSDLRHGYIIYTDRPIGIFNLNMEHGAAMLYGVGIAEAYRGKGYGSKLMGHAMREGLRLADRITLDVDSDNPVAYNLYLKCGFKTNFQVDYYRYLL